MDQKDRIDQDVAHRRLLSAVVVLSLRDACQTPGKYHLGDMPRSALNFLFESSDVYLSLLDIDPKQFRKRLVNLAYTDGGGGKFLSMQGFAPDERRRFRINYMMWMQNKPPGFVGSWNE